jgi:hypothetical protein
MNGVEQIQEYIEHGRRISQTGLDVNSQSVSNAFQTTDHCSHGQSCLDTHTVIPSFLLADLHIFWNTLFVSKTRISQNNGFTSELKCLSFTFMLAQSQAMTRQKSLSSQQNLMPTLQRPLSLPFSQSAVNCDLGRWEKSSQSGSCR